MMKTMLYYLQNLYINIDFFADTLSPRGVCSRIPH